MSDDEIIVHDTLEVDDDGYVTGSAYTRLNDDGVSVQASVTSYDFERHGETEMNHVPHIVVVAEGGEILAEPHAHDSQSAKKSIEEARNTVEWVFKNLSSYAD